MKKTATSNQNPGAARASRRRTLKALQERLDFLEKMCIALTDVAIEVARNTGSAPGLALAMIMSHQAVLAQHHNVSRETTPEGEEDA